MIRLGLWGQQANRCLPACSVQRVGEGSGAGASSGQSGDAAQQL